MIKLIYKNLAVLLIILAGININIFAGQNSGAGIRIDFNTTTSGNQNLTSISCPGTNSYVRVDIYVVSASNLDTYEFNINYNTSDLQFIGGSEDQPITFESNFLKKDGGSTTGFMCTANGGVVNCANTLVGNQGDNTPDGEGLLASIVFKALVDCPSGISFGDVDWYDNNGIKDVCTDKGSDGALPVELSSFTAKPSEENVALHWTTKTEINNYGFEIERVCEQSAQGSKTNSKWEKIGFIKGCGNSNSVKNYFFTDKNLVGGSKFIYRLKQIDNDGKFSYSDETKVEVVPDKYELFQNYPNPFNPVTNIKFQVVNPGLVTLKVYDILGNEVATIVNKELAPGFYNYQWNASKIASGIYLYRITAGNFTAIKKMLLLK